MAQYLDYERLQRFWGKVKSLLNLKADKTDTYTKSEVDALVAEGGGGGVDNGIVIPEDTFVQNFQGDEIAYALSGITTKEITLRIISPDSSVYYNGFAFQTQSKYIQFDIGYENDVYDCIYMRQKEGDRYHFSGSDESFTKSSKRRFHTFYWTNNRIKCDLKKIMNFSHDSSDSPKGDELDIHVKSQTEFTIINFSQKCKTLYARPTSDKYLYDIIVVDQDNEDYRTVSTVDVRNTQLHFSAFEDNALPKHQNIFVTNNSIKATYYPNPVYFVTTKLLSSSFDFVGDFPDSVCEKILTFFKRDSFSTYVTSHGQQVNRIFDPKHCSLRISGRIDKNTSFDIRYEEPPIPLNKKDYIYNGKLVYMGRLADAAEILGISKYDACIYRYRVNHTNYSKEKHVKFRKVNLSTTTTLDNRLTPWGNYHVRKISKTGVKSVVTDVYRIRLVNGGKVIVNQ